MEFLDLESHVTPSKNAHKIIRVILPNENQCGGQGLK